MMIPLLKIYWPILLSIGTASLFIIMGGLCLIMNSVSREQKTRASLNPINDNNPPLVSDIKIKPITISSQDINAISGDDVMATQLDLARAYIETGRKLLAKKILTHVVKFGKMSQQREAQNLMLLLELDTRE